MAKKKKQAKDRYRTLTPAIQGVFLKKLAKASFFIYTQHIMKLKVNQKLAESVGQVEATRRVLPFQRTPSAQKTLPAWTRPFVYILLCLWLVSCVSTRQALQGIEVGTTKEQVWNTIGKPFKVARHEGRFDRWTYRYKWDSQEYTQDLFFDAGQVVRTGPLVPYPNYEQKMAMSDTLEEYEMNAILYQRQKEAGFRDINSLNTKREDVFCSHYLKGKTVAKCHNAMRGKVFMPSALRFCHTHITGSEDLKLEGLLLTANKSFSPLALRFCRNKIKGSLSKIKCLSAVADKEFSVSNLRFCDQKHSNATKLSCLKNAGYKPL